MTLVDGDDSNILFWSDLAMQSDDHNAEHHETRGSRAHGVGRELPWLSPE